MVVIFLKKPSFSCMTFARSSNSVCFDCKMLKESGRLEKDVSRVWCAAHTPGTKEDEKTMVSRTETNVNDIASLENEEYISWLRNLKGEIILITNRKYRYRQQTGKLGSWSLFMKVFS